MSVSVSSVIYMLLDSLNDIVNKDLSVQEDRTEFTQKISDALETVGMGSMALPKKVVGYLSVYETVEDATNAVKIIGKRLGNIALKLDRSSSLHKRLMDEQDAAFMIDTEIKTVLGKTTTTA